MKRSLLRLSAAVMAGFSVLAFIGLMMAGCGGGGGGGDSAGGNNNVVVQTYSISGSVTSSGTGMSGIAVALSEGGSATTTTDSSGHYSFANLANGSYTVTPTVTAGYHCSPESRTQTVNGANISNVNFTAAEAPTYSISGSVTASGTALPGVSVALTGTITATIPTDSSGNYIFSGLTNGDYTVTPSITGYTFTPSFSTKTVSGANVAGVNFTAATSANIPTIYVIDNLGNLGTVNVTNGDVHVIGNTGVVMTDIAFDASGVLYGVSTDKLYKINKSTAASTLIGSLGITDATSLEFNKGGSVLYTANNQLHTVDTTTGLATSIPSSNGFPFSSSGDLTSIGDKFYLTSKIAGDVTNNDLVSLDTSTGTGTLVGHIGFPNVYALATNDNVHLYGFSNGNLISINTTTGVGTLVKDISGKGLSNINGASSN
jgi:hypothetical protein